MRILTLDNEFYNLETLPEEIDDLRFAISIRLIAPIVFVAKHLL